MVVQGWMTTRGRAVTANRQGRALPSRRLLQHMRTGSAWHGSEHQCSQLQTAPTAPPLPLATPAHLRLAVAGVRIRYERASSDLSPRARARACVCRFSAGVCVSVEIVVSLSLSLSLSLSRSLSLALSLSRLSPSTPYFRLSVFASRFFDMSAILYCATLHCLFSIASG